MSPHRPPPGASPPPTKPPSRRNGKPVPPAVDDLVERSCDLDGCDRTYQAHATAPLTWCSADHRKRDPRGGLG